MFSCYVLEIQKEIGSRFNRGHTLRCWCSEIGKIPYLQKQRKLMKTFQIVQLSNA